MKNILKLIQDQEINQELEWYGKKGYYSGQHEIQVPYSNIFFNLEINAVSGCDKGDHITPPDTWIVSKEISITNIEMFDSDGNEIKLSEMGYYKILSALEMIIKL